MTRNKYNARKTVVDGITFDSAKEARRYGELKLLDEAGKIQLLSLHPKFELGRGSDFVRIRSARYPKGRKCSYTADFMYFDNETKERVAEEVKSRPTDTEASRLRRAVAEYFHDIKVRVV